ncbi:MAG: hypothetical protein AMXMBFR33_33420 [Candidatus Xenobia bacterium]
MSSNRLSQETSPYLLQHANNPVDWYPWGEEALERARREDRPIFLSIGYSACHWCHVMEHESFEDPGIARVMNEHYVNIKVDREERPDLDRIYMQAVQILTGHGGWPMSVWLTPQLEPYYGGTYFPPESRMGMPGFPDLMLRLAEAYRERRQDVAATAKELVEALEKTRRLPEKPTMLDSSLLDEAMHRMQRQFDPRNGGFGGRPKFPNPLKLSALLRLDSPIARAMVETTLTKMARGGLYDQLGGGFHRYSVDEKWLVPHFEKMLYDNALLSELYLEAWQATGEELFQRIAVETLDYVTAEMTDPQGGFYSTQDADSEGEEGKFFVWTPAELERLLGAEDARVVGEALGVERGGNFEHGTSILHRPLDEDVVAVRHDLKVHQVRERVEKARKILFEARKKRVAPGRDDKVLLAWNGLMAASFAKAGAALGWADYVATARRNVDFVLQQMSLSDGRLAHTWMAGRASGLGYVDDYAGLIWALLHLYQVEFDPSRVDQAVRLARLAVERFWDAEDRTFFLSDPDQKDLLMRPSELEDGATPSGNSMMLLCLLWLGRLTGEASFSELAESGIRRLAPLAQAMPAAFGLLLRAIHFYLGPPQEIVFTGPDPDLKAEVARQFLPRAILAQTGPSWPLLEGKKGPGVYVCSNYSCQAPVTRLEELNCRA